MKRGDLVLVPVSRVYGKVRPALVVQSDTDAELESVTLCLLTSDLAAPSASRVRVSPSKQNGLRQPSHIQADKLQTVPRDKVRACVGRLEAVTMRQVDQALALHLDLFIPSQ